MSPLHLRRLSDETLGSRLASGEAAAFDELYRRYVNRLAAYGAHLLGDAASGDDVAQATLLKAYTALRDGRLPERLKPWLYRIAHNTAIDTVARRRELPAAELPDRPAPGGELVAGALVAALASLPARQRRVYVLRELHGLRIDETATELDLTVSQVEQALFAARNRLAEHLVFGDRLNCVAVQRLAAGPLDGDERRALKTHLRSCADCRRQLGLRGRALGALPAAPIDWLRGLLTGLAGGGAPVAAKIGAVVATATIAAGVPVAVEVHMHAPRPVVAAAATATRIVPAAPPQAAPRPTGVPIGTLVSVAPRTAPRRLVAPPLHAMDESRSGGGDATRAGREDGASSGAASTRDGETRTSTGSGEDGGDHRSGSAPQSGTGSTREPGDSGSGSDHGSTDGAQTTTSTQRTTDDRPQTTDQTQTATGGTSTTPSGGDGGGDPTTTPTTTTTPSGDGSGDTLTSSLPTTTTPTATTVLGSDG